MIPTKDDLKPYLNNRKLACEKYNVSEKTIINWLKRYDLYEPRENYGCNKLNLDKAIEIRKLHKSGVKMKDLASQYKVTFATISRIVHNLIYKEFKNTADISVVYNVTSLEQSYADLSGASNLSGGIE